MTRNTRRQLAVRAVAIATVALAGGLLASTEVTLRAQLAESRERARLAREIDQLESALAAAAERLPPDGAASTWWRDRLGEGARTAGVGAPAITVARTDQRLGEWDLSRVDVTVAGDWESVARFLAWLERAVPRWRLERFFMEPAKQGQVLGSFQLLVPVPPERGS